MSDVLDMVDQSKSIRQGDTSDANPHVVHVVNHNLKLMKQKYTEINSNRKINFQPFVSVIGLGTLDNENIEENENFSSLKFDKVLQQSVVKKDFFDKNEVFEENDGIIRPRFEEISSEVTDVSPLKPDVNENIEQTEKVKPPPGLVSFASIIRSVNKK